MSYVQKSLTHDEQLLFEGRFPWIYHLASWVILFTLGWFLVGIYIWARMQIHFATTEIGVTSSRVLIKRGLFNTRTMELGLPSVEQVELRKSFWGQIFGYGTVEIHGSGEGEIETPPIAHPVAFRRVLSDAVTRSRNPKIRVDPDSFSVVMDPEDVLDYPKTPKDEARTHVDHPRTIPNILKGSRPAA